jgi:hypothetical protein
MRIVNFLLYRLPHPLRKWIKNLRTLLLHPMALTTFGVLFRRDAGADRGTPWWNDNAVRYLTGQLQPGDQVFEWGSGASTVWLCNQGAKVTSIEHDSDWVSNVIERCPGADIRTVPDSVQEYVAAIDGFADASFDVVIVDGLHRGDCLRRGAPKVKPGGLLILDDTDMSKNTRLRRTALPGWGKVCLTGFKTSGDVRQTTFFRRPGLAA